MLLTVLATLPFFAALLLAGVAIAATLTESGNKVVLALKGRSPLAEPVLMTRPTTVRFTQRAVPLRTAAVQPRWRAAA